ncbi:serine/threonine protein kinase [Leptolyngbya sp. 7M]|uniref:serine/threonine protein kinase n=1 Tax=Leptolyngbya sp. 7M TaxID=2812896 RepID=UPI001B8C2E6F|nr:serine/threonine-protein kinase [Leptolyngbya sp. 7M]QYO67221.1 serine/threonine protein kinase [Leptolyngbya sp. 7M]
MELGPDARREYLAKFESGEKTLFDELAGLLTVDTKASEFMKEPVFRYDPPNIIGEMVGKYRIVRELGRGGMGTVFEGVREDGDFDKRVAIKLTGHNLFSEELIRRFRNEKQILAQLEHPNIVRLFDGGVTGNHIPYYVMEYVEGTPLTKFCRDNQLSIKDRLHLFAHVLEGVSYAHRNLIVHRDLKPANILVTETGDVKLLDFGIAKVLEDESGTMTAGAPMTPEYASPEQIAQKPISTASDIYSLGVILFELLTDLPPNAIYKTGGLDLYRAVLNDEPLAPSTAANREGRNTAGTDRGEGIRSSRSLSGDLDNIVLKCLNKEPEQRYASADQLLADVKAYLDGRPVLAHPQSKMYRARKFIRRNRALVTAAAAALLLIFVGSGSAVYQSSIAREQQRLAESRFQQVRKVANALIFDYHDEIAKLEGSIALREKLVSDAVSYLDAIAAEEINDPELINELAIAYRKIGDVQGASYIPNSGDLRSALENYKRSVQLHEKLLVMDPAGLDARRELAHSYNTLANAFQRSGNSALGLDHLDKGIAILEERKNDLGVDEIYVLNEILRQRPAYITSNTNRYDGYSETVEKLKAVINQYPDEYRFKDQMAKVQSFAGNAARFAGYDLDDEVRNDEARKMYERALYHYLEFERYSFEVIPHLNNKTIVIRRKYGIALSLGDAYIRLGKLGVGQKYMAEAKEYNRQLRLDPSNKEARLDLLRIAHTDQDLLVAQGKLQDAISNIENAISLAKEIAESDPSNIELTYYLFHFHQKAAKLLIRIGKDKEAALHKTEESKYHAILQEKVGDYFPGKAYF